jgi:hypothetical protein
MCLICVEFQKQKMTVFEARSAFREMIVTMDAAHARQVREMLDEAEKKAREQASKDD